MSLPLTLNRCQKLFWCFHCWLQASNYRLSCYLNCFKSRVYRYLHFLLSCSSTLRKKCSNTELFLVRIQSECGKIRTRNNSVFGHFSRSATFLAFRLFRSCWSNCRNIAYTTVIVIAKNFLCDIWFKNCVFTGLRKTFYLAFVEATVAINFCSILANSATAISVSSTAETMIVTVAQIWFKRVFDSYNCPLTYSSY